MKGSPSSTRGNGLWLFLGVVFWGMCLAGSQALISSAPCSVSSITSALLLTGLCTYGLLYLGVRLPKAAGPFVFFLFPLIALPIGLLLGHIRLILVGPHY